MSDSAPTSSPWRRCNSCKKPIAYSAHYWVCNVSTCNRKATGFVFCEVSCWDAHLPLMNHRESWAEERKAPTREEWAKALSGEDKPVRRRSPSEELSPAVGKSEASSPAAPKTILRKRSE